MAVASAPKTALAKIIAYAPNAGKVVNGWQITLPAGVYGTDYLRRAFLNLLGPGWNLPEDAVYPIARVESEGKTLSAKPCGHSSSAFTYRTAQVRKYAHGL